MPANDQNVMPTEDQSNNAQGANQSGNGQGTDQSSNAQGDDQSSNGQGDDQSGNVQGTDQSGNAQGTNQSSNAEGTNQAPMSAEQIIGILQQEPVILANVKNMAARQLGVDPSTITDDALYNRIRQDISLREQITTELNNLGYSTNFATSSAANQRTRFANPRTSNGNASTERTFPRNQPAPYVEPNKPQAIRQPSPYGNLPSLRDLYSQTPSTASRLRRFGSDAFLLGTGNANQLPMDLPGRARLRSWARGHLDCEYVGRPVKSAGKDGGSAGPD